MKTNKLQTTLAAITMSLMAVPAAHAASTNKVLVSGPLILLFLGFCALVVAIQLIPAIITLYGMIKAALSEKKEEAANVKIH